MGRIYISLLVAISMFFVACKDEQDSCEIFVRMQGNSERLTICESSIHFEYMEIDDFTGESWKEVKDVQIIERRKYKKMDIFIISQNDSLYSRLFLIRKNVGNKEILSLNDFGFGFHEDLSSKSLEEINSMVDKELVMIEEYGGYPVPFDPFLKLEEDSEQKSANGYGEYVYSKKECVSLTLTENRISYFYSDCKNNKGKGINDLALNYDIITRFKIDDVYGYIVEDNSGQNLVLFVRFDKCESVNLLYVSVAQSIGDCVDKACVMELMEKKKELYPYCFDEFPFIHQD